MLANENHEWELEVRQRAANYRYPPTPDLSASRQQGPVNARRRRLRPALAVSFTLVAVLLLIGLSMPQARATVLEALRLGAIEIRLLESEPIIDAAALSIVDLGEPVTEADALTHFAGPLRHSAELGQPNAFFVHDIFGEIAAVTMLWQPNTRTDTPQIAVTQINSPGFVFKWAYGQQIEEITVNRQPGIWIEGPHPVQFESGIVDRDAVAQGNVLIWVDGRTTLRLEGDLTQEQALEIAAGFD
ncbi:MAG: hypothetical protein M9918_04770 [Anaerolineae bacterium]|nr:hypothetical protein [Anaerolineae bacterium]